MSPGPIFEPEGKGKDFWGAARALFAAGFRAGDVVHNCFSYHLTPGGFIMESGAHALGCAVIPGGTGNTEQQVEAIAHLKPSGYLGTPDFLKILLDAAAKAGKDASSLKRGTGIGRGLAGLAAPGIVARGIEVLQCYATADARRHRLRERGARRHDPQRDVLVEIVRPGTGDPVADGEVGEVVVTSFNPDYPMIRLATGDLSAVMRGPLALRAHQHAHRGLDGSRRPDHQGQGHVRASSPARRNRQAPSRARPVAAGGRRARASRT